MKRLVLMSMSLMSMLLIVFASGSYGQGLWHSWYDNGKQQCGGGYTPTAWGYASCYAPNVGPGGWRTVGGGLEMPSTCQGGSATAQIMNNLPGNYYVNWDGFQYGFYGNLARRWDAGSACDTTTDGTGNFAGAYDIDDEWFGC